MALFDRRPFSQDRQCPPRSTSKNARNITAFVFAAFFVVVSSCSLLAQNQNQNQADESATLRALNGQVLELQGSLLHADSQQRVVLQRQLHSILRKRSDLLKQLVISNPTEAASLAMSPELLAGISSTVPDATNILESHARLRGVVELSVEDSADLKHSHTHALLKSGNKKSIELKFAHGQRVPVSGESVEVTGVITGAYMAVTSTQPSYTTSATSTSTSANCSQTGDQKTAVVLVSIPNGPIPTGVSVQSLEDVFFAKNSSGPSVDGFLREASYGKASASGDVLGPFALNGSYTSCSDVGGSMLNDAVAAAIASGVNLANYSRLFLVFPDIWGCGWSGFAQVNACSLQTTSGTFNLSLSEISAAFTTPRAAGVELDSHEMGHNLGLLHSGRVQASLATDAIGPLNSPGTFDDLDDWWSVMGSNDPGLYPSPQRSETLGWMAPTKNYQVVQSSGTFTLQPLSAASTGLQAIKVQRGTGNNEWLWLEYRQPVGSYDSGLLPQPYSGALIHYQDANTQSGHSYLANFTPSDTSWMSPALAVGNTWKDPYSNVSISVLSATSSALTVSVSYGASTCSPANPTVSMTPLNPSTMAGSGVNFNVTVQNNDSSACSSTTFVPSSSQPTGWAASFSPGSLTLAPGQSGTITLAITPPTGTPVGTFAVTATASNLSYSGTSSANVTVMNPPQLTATLSASSTSYTKRSTASFTATVTQNRTPVAGAIVTFTINTPNGSTLTQSATTGRKGTASWNYKFNQQSQSGLYSAVATAGYNSQSTSSNTVVFNVQ